MPEIADSMGRTPIANGMKELIDAQFKALPEYKRGAVLVIADEQGARAHLAAKLNGHWKVAGGASFVWTERKPAGWIGVEFAW